MDRSIYGNMHGSHRSLVDPYAVYGQQDEDSMYLQQVQGLQNLGYSQSLDGIHPLDYASRSVEMELAERELAEVERIRLFRLQQLQEAEKMRQMDELQHMYNRNMSLGTLSPSISARNMSMYGNLEPIASHRPMDRAMNHYSSELEYIDQPHFDRRALPEYYISTRTVDERKKRSSDRSRRSGRSRSHGRLRSRSERRSDRHERDRHDHRRRRSSTPSRSRRRDDPSSDEDTVSSSSRAGRRSGSRNQRSSSRSPVKSSSRRPSRPNLPRSGGKGNSTTRRSKYMPRRSKNEETSDESESDESWNKIGSTRDLIKGLKTENSWLQQASDVVKGTFDVVLNGPSDESSSEDSSSDNDSDDSTESK